MDPSRWVPPKKTWATHRINPSLDNEHEFLRQAKSNLAAFRAGDGGRADDGSYAPLTQPSKTPVAVTAPPLPISLESEAQRNVTERGSDILEISRRLSFKEAVHQKAASAKGAQHKAQQIPKTADAIRPEPCPKEPPTSVNNSLPVSALPYTLRSSSLTPSTQPLSLVPMTGPSGAGLGASRYASSTNPLVIAENARASAPNTRAHASPSSSNPRQATVIARLSSLRDKKAIEREIAAEQEKARLRAEVLQAELQEAEELEQEEARRTEADRVENEKKEKGRILTIKKDAANAEAKNKETPAPAIENKQAIGQMEKKLEEIQTAEVDRKKRREAAGMTALEELSRADARVKDLTKDKNKFSKLVEQHTMELKAIDLRLMSSKAKLDGVQGELLEAQKVVDAKNKKVTEIEESSKIARAAFEKEDAELKAKIETLRVGHPAAVPAVTMNDSASVPLRAKSAAIKAAIDPARLNVQTMGQEKFTAWPMPTQDRDASQVRRVKLTGFPDNATLANVQMVVWGGNIQEFQYQPGAPIAIALFVKAEDCAKFFAATPNGIPYPGDTARTIMVEKLESEPAHGIVKDYIEKDITRCIRVFDIDAEWGKLALHRLAQGSNKRIVERVVNGQNSQGRRVADFRFAKISDAVHFKGELDRSVDWDACTIKYGPDPCAVHDTVHTGLM